jgi:regulator of extracellular matrix RemA (YlzA/DUF370 family)
LVVDASCGKKTCTVFIMDSGHIILSAKNIKGFSEAAGIKEVDDE